MLVPLSVLTCSTQCRMFFIIKVRVVKPLGYGQGKVGPGWMDSDHKSRDNIELELHRLMSYCLMSKKVSTPFTRGFQPIVNIQSLLGHSVVYVTCAMVVAQYL